MKKRFLPFAFAIITSFTQAEENNAGNYTNQPITNIVNPYFQLNHYQFDNIQSRSFFSKYFLTTLLNEPFNNFTDNGWTTYSVSGSQVWTIGNFGNPAPDASMNGFGGVNEDWLISKNINLTSGYTSASFSFQSDGRYTGNPLEVYITTNAYINGQAPNTVAWTKLNAIFDTNMASFGEFASSGNIDLTAYLGNNVRIAFKYTNDQSTASAWEIDNLKVIASENVNLGVADVSSEKMKLYPNPVKDILNFPEEVTNVKITDISGKIVNTILKGKSIDLSKLKKGVYVVIANVKSGETITNKIVKE